MDYPFSCGGAHVKIMLPRPGQREIVLPTPTDKGPRWLDPAQKPVIRTFTIRAFRREALELDIDFALHGEAFWPRQSFLPCTPNRVTGSPSRARAVDPMLQTAEHYYMAGIHRPCPPSAPWWK